MARSTLGFLEDIKPRLQRTRTFTTTTPYHSKYARYLPSLLSHRCIRRVSYSSSLSSLQRAPSMHQTPFQTPGPPQARLHLRPLWILPLFSSLLILQAWKLVCSRLLLIQQVRGLLRMRSHPMLVQLPRPSPQLRLLLRLFLTLIILSTHSATWSPCLLMLDTPTE